MALQLSLSILGGKLAPKFKVTVTTLSLRGDRIVTLILGGTYFNDVTTVTTVTAGYVLLDLTRQSALLQRPVSAAKGKLALSSGDFYHLHIGRRAQREPWYVPMSNMVRYPSESFQRYMEMELHFDSFRAIIASADGIIQPLTDG